METIPSHILDYWKENKETLTPTEAFSQFLKDTKKAVDRENGSNKPKSRHRSKKSKANKNNLSTLSSVAESSYGDIDSYEDSFEFEDFKLHDESIDDVNNSLDLSSEPVTFRSSNPSRKPSVPSITEKEAISLNVIYHNTNHNRNNEYAPASVTNTISSTITNVSTNFLAEESAKHKQMKKSYPYPPDKSTYVYVRNNISPKETVQYRNASRNQKKSSLRDSVDKPPPIVPILSSVEATSLNIIYHNADSSRTTYKLPSNNNTQFDSQLIDADEIVSTEQPLNTDQYEQFINNADVVDILYSSPAEFKTVDCESDYSADTFSAELSGHGEYVNSSEHSTARSGICTENSTYSAVSTSNNVNYPAMSHSKQTVDNSLCKPTKGSLASVSKSKSTPNAPRLPNINKSKPYSASPVKMVSSPSPNKRSTSSNGSSLPDIRSPNTKLNLINKNEQVLLSQKTKNKTNSNHRSVGNSSNNNNKNNYNRNPQSKKTLNINKRSSNNNSEVITSSSLPNNVESFDVNDYDNNSTHSSSTDLQHSTIDLDDSYNPVNSSPAVGLLVRRSSHQPIINLDDSLPANIYDAIMVDEDSQDNTTTATVTEATAVTIENNTTATDATTDTDVPPKEALLSLRTPSHTNMITVSVTDTTEVGTEQLSRRNSNKTTSGTNSHQQLATTITINKDKKDDESVNYVNIGINEVKESSTGNNTSTTTAPPPPSLVMPLASDYGITVTTTGSRPRSPAVAPASTPKSWITKALGGLNINTTDTTATSVNSPIAQVEPLSTSNNRKKSTFASSFADALRMKKQVLKKTDAKASLEYLLPNSPNQTHLATSYALFQPKAKSDEDAKVLYAQRQMKWDNFCNKMMKLGLQITNDRIEKGDRLGRGKFASVYFGTLKSEPGGGNSLLAYSDQGIANGVPNSRPGTASRAPSRNTSSFNLLSIKKNQKSSTAYLLNDADHLPSRHNNLVLKTQIAMKVANFSGNDSVFEATAPSQQTETLAQRNRSKFVKSLFSNLPGTFSVFDDVPREADDPDDDLANLLSELGGGELGEDNYLDVEDDDKSYHSEIVLTREILPPPQVLDEYEREIDALHALSKCPHIIKLYGLILRPLAIVLQKMDFSLADYMASDKWKSVKQRQKLGVVFTITAGLASMHKNLWIHRDLKPHNILVRVEKIKKDIMSPRHKSQILKYQDSSSDSVTNNASNTNTNTNDNDDEIESIASRLPTTTTTSAVIENNDDTSHKGEVLVEEEEEDAILVKIGDLGTSVRVASATSRELRDACGTSGYTAPEILRGENGYGLPADVFSYGILCWEIFSTTPQANPLKGLDPTKAVQNIEEGLRPTFDVVEHPLLIKKIINMAWRTDPETRPQMNDIEALIDRYSNLESF